MFFRRLENREKLKKLNSEKGSERSSPFCFFFFIPTVDQTSNGGRKVFHRTRRDKDNRCIVCHFLDWFTLGVWYRQRYFKRRHLLELCTEARHNELPCRLLLVVASVEHQNIQQNVSSPLEWNRGARFENVGVYVVEINFSREAIKGILSNVFSTWTTRVKGSILSGYFDAQ